MARQTRVLLVVVLLLAAVGSSPATESSKLDDAEGVVRQVLRTWSDHEVGRLGDLFAEDGIYEDVPPKITYEGVDEIKGFMAAIWSWAPDIEFTPTSVVQTDGKVVAEWTMKGTQTGPIGAIPASGKSFSVRGASVVTFEKGRIVRYSDYYDLASILVQFGVRCSAPPPFEAAGD